MSRVHKYRAWYKPSKQMVRVIGINWDFENGEITDIDYVEKDRDGDLIWNANIDNVELMEFTGLLDKNGVEIYEGDIIKIESIVYYSDSSKKVYRNGKVIWNQNKSRFEVFLSKKHYNTFIWAVNEQSEVIGNIFENPEYLEE